LEWQSIKILLFCPTPYYYKYLYVVIDNRGNVPTITIELDEDVNRLVEIYQASKKLPTKQLAMNGIIKDAKDAIIKGVKV